VYDHVHVDTTPPAPGKVTIGQDYEAHTTFHNNPKTVWLWWEGFTEDVSVIVAYYIEIFEAASKKSVYPKTLQGLVDSTFAMGLHLRERRAYFARVYAENSVRLQSYADSETFIVQTTHPALANVYGECP
jgi:hypothetical protein